MTCHYKEMYGKNAKEEFAWIYKRQCHEFGVKPLSAVQAYLKENQLRFCTDRLDLEDWSPILNGIAQNHNLSKIYIYSRYRRRKIRENINTEEKLQNLGRAKVCDRPVLYTNILLRCLADSNATCLKSSRALTSLTFDGIPLSSKYLKILCNGLENNRTVTSLSLARCCIGDIGCDLLLESLQNNMVLYSLNLTSCRLTMRSAAFLVIFLKRRKKSLLRNAWEESTMVQSSIGVNRKSFIQHCGLRVLTLNGNRKFSDIGVRQVTDVLKGDFWMRVLNLRQCGLSKLGGDAIVQLLELNSVLVAMDLRGNEIPEDIARNIGRIFNKREKGELLSMRQRLINRRRIYKWNTLKKQTVPYKEVTDSKGYLIPMVHESAYFNKRKKYPKPRESRRSLQNIQVTQHPEQCKRTKSQSKGLEVKNKSSIERGSTTNLCDLKTHLKNIVESNEDLMKKLQTRVEQLDDEKVKRLKTEDICEKVKFQLKCLKVKIVK